MNNREQIPTQVIITQDKLVDLLLHAATREDIAKYAADSKADIARYTAENKADIAKCSGDILRLETNLKDAILELKRANDALESRIDRQFIKLSDALEASKSHNDRQFLKIDQRYSWIIGIVIATGITLAGMIAKGFHWF